MLQNILQLLAIGKNYRHVCGNSNDTDKLIEDITTACKEKDISLYIYLKVGIEPDELVFSPREIFSSRGLLSTFVQYVQFYPDPPNGEDPKSIFLNYDLRTGI